MWFEFCRGGRSAELEMSSAKGSSYRSGPGDIKDGDARRQRPEQSERARESGWRPDDGSLSPKNGA